MKRENNLGFVGLFLLFVIVVISIIGLLYFSWQNGFIKTNLTQEIIKPSPVATSGSTPTPYETVENGVYTNNKYGFSFSYPKNIFITFKDNKPREEYSAKLEAEFTNIEGPPDRYPKYSMLVYFEDLDAKAQKFYEEYERSIDLPKYDSKEERSKNNNEKVVKKLTADGNPAYILYSYLTPHATDIEPSEGHGLVLLKEKLQVSIYITTPISAELSEKRLEILEDISESVEFF